jgi:hypothetical protein
VGGCSVGGCNGGRIQAQCWGRDDHASLGCAWGGVGGGGTQSTYRTCPQESLG